MRPTSYVFMVLAAALLAACTPAQTGGDTSCKDFLAADQEAQTSAVAKMLKDEKGADAATLEITATRLGVQTYCSTVATQDTKIKTVPHL